ncbi:hypothetical protein GCM10027590_27380 [Nocardiopsis nanhaiensis]
MTREAPDGDDLDARSGDGHNHAAGKEGLRMRVSVPENLAFRLFLAVPFLAVPFLVPLPVPLPVFCFRFSLLAAGRAGPPFG